MHVGVADAAAPGGWKSRTLREVHPYYWAKQLTQDGGWPPFDLHTE